MKYLLLFGCLLLLSFHINTQIYRPISIHEESTSFNNTRSLYAENKTYATWTLYVSFRSLTGYTFSGLESGLIRLPSGRTNIGRLTPNANSKLFNSQYSYQYYLGAALKKCLTLILFIYYHQLQIIPLQ